MVKQWIVLMWIGIVLAGCSAPQPAGAAAPADDAAAACRPPACWTAAAARAAGGVTVQPFMRAQYRDARGNLFQFYWTRNETTRYGLLDQFMCRELSSKQINFYFQLIDGAGTVACDSYQYGAQRITVTRDGSGYKFLPSDLAWIKPAAGGSHLLEPDPVMAAEYERQRRSIFGLPDAEFVR